MILRVWRGKEDVPSYPLLSHPSLPWLLAGEGQQEGEEAPPGLLPLLMSSQTSLPLASAVVAPGFGRLPAVGLTRGLSPSTSLSAVASFLDLAAADSAIILCV